MFGVVELNNSCAYLSAHAMLSTHLDGCYSDVRRQVCAVCLRCELDAVGAVTSSVRRVGVDGRTSCDHCRHQQTQQMTLGLRDRSHVTTLYI